ncbi:unnamed protein product, partial (mitochondrion) [Lodderomyces beijingensis]
KYISLLMLLYAGNASLSSFKYSLFIDTVKKLKQWSQSAGNALLSIQSGTSETIRDNTEHILNISIHVPTHLRPLNDEQFGHYLAGLIDGDGHFSSQQQLIIVFTHLDASLAYYIKSKIGYGNIRKVKDKNVFLYIISNKDGLLKTIHLINNKLRTINKYNQVINILNNPRYSDNKIKFDLNKTNDFNNHWLAGFSDADASFQVKIINRITRSKPEIRLNFQIDQKDNNLLLIVKNLLGGNIGYRKSQDTYYYGSTSFGSARKVIKYFDNYHLQSSKYSNYLKWRKIYIMIQNKEHLAEIGINKISRLKESMNDGSV